jgi:hypothetical protein
MSKFNAKTASYPATFTPENVVLVAENGKGEPVVVYTNDFKGKTYFHLRALYGDGGKWSPRQRTQLARRSSAGSVHEHLQAGDQAERQASRRLTAHAGFYAAFGPARGGFTLTKGEMK